MLTRRQNPETVPVSQALLAHEEPHWYAIQTRARHEKKVATQLQSKGATTFLPLLSQVHHWSDRRKMVHLPLFACYTFMRAVFSPEMCLMVLRTGGVVRLVGVQGKPLPVPDKQIEDIQTLLAQKVPCKLYPFLRAGQRVRIRGGCLDGIEGLLVDVKGDRSLVISVDSILQGVALRIEGYDVEILSPPCPP